MKVKLKHLLHCMHVICGGGHMACIRKGCETYHGTKPGEFGMFFSVKYMNHHFGVIEDGQG